MALPEENNVTMIDDINPYDIVSKPQNVNLFNLGLTIPKTNLGLTQNFNLPFNQFMLTYRSTNVQPPQSTIYTPKTFDQETRFREMYGTMGDKKDRKKFNKYWKSDQRWEDYDKFASEEHSKFMQSIDDTLARLKLESLQAVKNTVNSYKPFELTVEQPVVDFNNVLSVQNWLNTKFNSGLTADNMYGLNTNNAITTALQRTDLTDVERLGLTSLLNSWKDRMIGLKKLTSNPHSNTTKDLNIPSNYFRNVSTLDDAPLDIQQTYKTSNSYNNQYQFTPEQLINFQGTFSDEYGALKGMERYLNKYHNANYSMNNPELKKILLDLINNYYDLKETKFGSKYYLKKLFKQGGLINKHQQGGTMANNEQELLKAFMAFLIEDAAAQGMQIQSEEDLKAYAQQLGKEGLQAKYQEFMQRMQGGVKAKLGAKLDYIRKIKGLCQEDEELVYMKKGGRVCPVCEKKKKQAMKAEEGDKLDPVKKFKCGRKVKKAEPGAKFTQKTKTDKYGNTTHTRTYPGHKPVSYTVSEDGEGEGYYSDHKGRSRVEDQDSLGRVYHNGPLKLKKINKHQYGGPLSDEQSLYLTDKEAYEQYLKSQNDYYSQLADENEVTWNPITWGKELYYRYKSVPMLGGRSENENPFILTGTAPGPGMKAKNALEALQIVKSMKAAKAAKAAKAVKTLPTSINESGLTKSGKDNINRIINALPEAERQPIINALLQNEKFWNTYGDGFFNVSPNRAASTINAIRRKLGFSGLGNNYAGTVKYGRQMSGFKERMTEDATSLTTGTKRTTTLKPDK